MQPRIRSLVKKLKKIHPTSAADLRRGKIKFRFLDEGCYRKVYSILGTGTVIKFPFAAKKEYLSDSIAHALREMMAFSKVRKRRKFRKHLPKIYYQDLLNGVMLMKEYRRGGTDDWKEKALIRRFRNSFRSPCGDLGWYNMGRDEKGTNIFLDLGLF